jgi:hypothetical protein
VQSVLLCGCETWVVSKQILVSLEGFHHQIVQQLMHHTIRPDPNSGEWIYPDAGRSLELAGLHPMTTYIEEERVLAELGGGSMSVPGVASACFQRST